MLENLEQNPHTTNELMQCGLTHEAHLFESETLEKLKFVITPQFFAKTCFRKYFKIASDAPNEPRLNGPFGAVTKEILGVL